MSDLPTRLRTRADLHDNLTAGLMREAADDIERLCVDLDTCSSHNVVHQLETARLHEALAYIRDWPTVHDSGKPFNRDELVLLLAEMALEAAKVLKLSPASSPIVKAEE